MTKHWNSPTYTKEVLIPQHLNVSLDKLDSMNDQQLKIHLESVRVHIVSLITKKYTPFGSNLNENAIIQNLKKLNTELSVELILPNENTTFYTDATEDFEDGLLRYKPNHTKAINHWFFEMWEAETSSGINPLKQFHYSNMFQRNLTAFIKKNKFKIKERNSNARLSDCFAPLRITNGSKPVFNFSSSLAKWIYLNYANRNLNTDKDFYILDTSSGWGGRLGGALAASNHFPLNSKFVHYYGTDVNSSTHDQFYKLESYWKEHINTNLNFELYKSLEPAETILNDKVFNEHIGKFDIALTSPPYFDVERYSKDVNQSYLKYPLYSRGEEKSWKHGFLKRMIQNTFELLKSGGEFWLNVSDFNSKYGRKSLEYDSVKFAKECGFIHIRTYKMITPNIYPIIENRTKNSSKKAIIKTNVVIHNGKELKFEPIFVFLKP